MALFKKKPQSETAEEDRDISGDVVEQDFIPYACHWDAHTIVTKNGEVLQILKFDGIPAQQTERDESDIRDKIREAITRCITATHYAVWIHTIRRKRNFQAGGEFKRDFAGYLNRFWDDRNNWERQFINEIYITIVREGEHAKLTDPQGFMRGIIPYFDRKHREEKLDALRDELNGLMGKMLAVLAPYGARRLGLVRKDDTYYSEPCAFLSKLITFTDAQFPLADIDLSYYLADCDVTFGFNAAEVRMRVSGQRRFGAMLTVKDYHDIPAESVEALLRIPAEYIIWQGFEFIGSKRALRDFEKQKEIFETSKMTGLADKTGLNAILASNKGKPTDYGHHQTQILILADTTRSLETGITHAVGELSQLGIIPIREDIKLEECYWAMLPSNFIFMKRQRPINTAALGVYAHMTGLPKGRQSDNHWGPALTTVKTATGVPYFFSFHVGDNGHTTVIGPEGSGKTVFINFMLAQATKFQGQIFVFDHQRRTEILLRSLGGSYYNPYPQADKRAYAQLQMNPLALENTPANLAFLCQWLAVLIGEDAVRTQQICQPVLSQCMAMPAGERRLSVFVKKLKGVDAEWAAKFARWSGQGEQAALFDQPQDSLTFADKIVGFEMADVEKHAATVPILFYLLHRIELALTGAPAIIVLDEAWTLLNGSPLTGHMNAWLERLRARNAMVIFATGHSEHILRHPLTAELLALMGTQIYLPDEDAEAAHAQAFALSEQEMSYLDLMNDDDRHFMIKQAGEAVIAELNLSGMTDIHAVLDATAPHLDIMDREIAAHGQQASQWMPKFLAAL